MNKTRIPIEYVTDKMESFLDGLVDNGFISKRIIRNRLVITWNDRFTKFMNKFGVQLSFGTFLLNTGDNTIPLPLSDPIPYNPLSLSFPTPFSPSTPIGFDHFFIWWDLLPRKVNKAYALKCWNETMPKFEVIGMDWEAFEKRTLEYVAAWKDMDQSVIPHPSTWLNQMRWAERPEQLISIKTASVSNSKESKIVLLLNETLVRLTGIEQRPRDLDSLNQAAERMSIAFTAITDNRDVAYHTVSHLNMVRSYCAYLEIQYDGFKGLTAAMLGPSTKSWERFIVQFQQSIGMSLTTGGTIHCAGEKWTTLLSGKS